LIRFNIKLPAEKESELWQLVDANGDGDITYNEFKV
jgi:Ca2+-binding EF-hand superfamily protein